MKRKLGNIILEFMENGKLVTRQLVKLNKTQHNIYITPEKLTNELDETWKDIVVPDKHFSVKTTIISPIRLPMIVPPKLYKKMNIRVSLGGYLLNDVKYTDSFILTKNKQAKLPIIHENNLIYDVINNMNSVGFKY